MKTAFIVRTETSNEGTFGTFFCPELNFSCFTLELPDRNNKRSMSRIPAGDYVSKLYSSAKYTEVWHLQDVKDRTAILIHTGNYAGDTTKGWKTHSEGCILFGSSKGVLNGQKAILNSTLALNNFRGKMKKENFNLIIR